MPKHEDENKRSLSFTSVIVKMLKQIIRKELSKYFAENMTFSENQHSFRTGYSCLTNLLIDREIWYAFKYQNLLIELALGDFSKAFDKFIFSQML